MVGFRHTSAWLSHVCTCVPHHELLSYLPPYSTPQGSPLVSALNAPLHASNVPRSSILHMVIYMFQSYSLKSSHPRLLPHSPKVCSLYLCLFCCLVCRVIVTVFLNSIYMHSYTILLFLFLTYFTLYNRLKLHLPH